MRSKIDMLTKDLIDSRDLDARIEELQTDIDALDDSTYHGEDAEQLRWEIKCLTELQEFGKDHSGAEWRHGVTLVRHTYWVDYVHDFLEEIGVLPKNLPVYLAIDWEKTADNIAADYAESDDCDGTSWLVRAS